jgi:hypothetical protein
MAIRGAMTSVHRIVMQTTVSAEHALMPLQAWG